MSVEPYSQDLPFSLQDFFLGQSFAIDDVDSLEVVDLGRVHLRGDLKRSASEGSCLLDQGDAWVCIFRPLENFDCPVERGPR